MPNIKDDESTQEGVDGPVPLQEWFVDSRYGYVVTRMDENDQRVVLWQDIENMFANNVPKYAKRKGEYPISFHVHRNLTESLDKVSDRDKVVGNELNMPDMLLVVMVFLVIFWQYWGK
ncbi:MAG: hypothetical protein J3R72DRAFT_416923 [Linnemannia gamsii]|nr:MAG: hypothetical protein J3R72DRAFT_416923 [Linnemannia gamsii]